MHFESPEMYFVPLEIDFQSLEIHFEPLQMHFEPPEIHFGPPVLYFEPLEGSFGPFWGDSQAHRRCSEEAALRSARLAPYPEDTTRGSERPPPVPLQLTARG